MSYEFFNRNTQSFIYGLQVNPCQRMLDFDFVCGRDLPSVAGFIDPGREGHQKVFFGSKEILIPIYPSIAEAVKHYPAVSVLVNFASMRSAYQSALEALDADSIKVIAIIAEGVPERRTRELIAKAKLLNKVIIGPATVGGIKAGVFKIGNTGGTIENIIASKLHRSGSVGFVAKSGGMSNEMFNVIARHTDGINEGIAIGGDRFPGTTLFDHLIRFEKNSDIKMLVMLGELGGIDEYAICDALTKKIIKKPLVVWVTGTSAKAFSTEVQFGHAGAKAGNFKESAEAKNDALRRAGAQVPHSFDDFGELIGKVFLKLKKQGKIREIVEPEIKILPSDFEQLRKAGRIRRSTNFICAISDDRGEEAIYGKYPISEVIEKGFSLGDVISILWLKKKLPKYVGDFIEMVLKIVADHGPSVSGAHNAIITARAGKDLVSSLCSGLLTVGQCFGGAIDGAAYYFKSAFDRKLSPADFVKEMKSKNINIPGIGHLVKSVQNPDKRVDLLKNFAKKYFQKAELLEYALEVEKITTTKKNNLILNVDGCIGVLFIDLMRTCGQFTEKETTEVIESGALNGLFVLGRSIGIIGHILDQKRWKQGLYRHPSDDILFI